MECKNCRRKFTRKSHYDRHVDGHAKMISCPLCAKRFACTGNMTRHRISVHREGPEGVPLKCRKCEQRFTRLDHLKRHAQLHGSNCKNEREARRVTVHLKSKTVARYVCPVCSKPFARAKEMERHKAGHPPVEPEKPVDAATIQKAVEDGWMVVREGLYSSDGINAVRQFRLPFLDKEDIKLLDRDVSSAFLKLIECEGFMYHVDLTFTAVVDCGKLLVSHVNKPLFAERGGGLLLLSDMVSLQTAAWRLKDIFGFVQKHCDYGILMAVPSVRFHIKSIDGVPHVPYATVPSEPECRFPTMPTAPTVPTESYGV